jgi:hypothetical protein
MLSNESAKNYRQKLHVTGQTAPVIPDRKPIDVSAFLKRTDIPEDARERVLAAGRVHGHRPTTPEEAEGWRLMQAQVLIELAALPSKAADNAK